MQSALSELHDAILYLRPKMGRALNRGFASKIVGREAYKE